MNEEPIELSRECLSLDREVFLEAVPGQAVITRDLLTHLLNVSTQFTVRRVTVGPLVVEPNTFTKFRITTEMKFVHADLPPNTEVLALYGDMARTLYLLVSSFIGQIYMPGRIVRCQSVIKYAYEITFWRYTLQAVELPLMTNH